MNVEAFESTTEDERVDMTPGRTAAVFGRALEYGLVDPIAVVAWVDDLILSESHPSYSLLDASLSLKSPQKLIAALNSYALQANSSTSHELAADILGYFYEVYLAEPTKAARISRAMFDMGLAGETPNEELESRVPPRIERSLAYGIRSEIMASG